MTPQDVGRRIAEAEIDDLLERQLKANSALAAHIFEVSFGDDLTFHRIIQAAKNLHVDFRSQNANLLDYGENDVEAIAEMFRLDGTLVRVALFIENKIDARLMPDQGLRYRARAERQLSQGQFDAYRCIFVAPQEKIRQLYPLKDHEKAGWHNVFSFESLAEKLAHGGQLVDAQLLSDATLSVNQALRPIPSAVQFWQDYETYARSAHRDVDVRINTQVGSRAGGVWPSFFDQAFRGSRVSFRKRVQIVHVDNAQRVVLYLKRVTPQAFSETITPLIPEGMTKNEPRTSWQGVKIDTPPIDPRLPLATQLVAMEAVFTAAKKLKLFFDDNENAIKQLIEMS